MQLKLSRRALQVESDVKELASDGPAVELIRRAAIAL
jgi:hypothetical protein